MGNYTDSPRDLGANTYTAELRDSIWRVIDPAGVQMSPLYPNCRHAMRSATYLSGLARATDADWTRQIDAGKDPYAHQTRGWNKNRRPK